MAEIAEPRIIPVKVGWAALGNGWAVFGSTRNEAVRQFRDAQRRHAEIETRRIEDKPRRGMGNAQQ